MSKKNYKSLYKDKKDEIEMLKDDNEMLRNYVSSMYNANVKSERQRTSEMLEAQRLLALVPSLNHQISTQNAQINTLRKALASAGSCSAKEKEIDDLKEKIKQCEEGKKKCEEEKKALQIEFDGLFALEQSLTDKINTLERDEEQKRLQLGKELLDIKTAKTAIEEQLRQCNQNKTQYENGITVLKDRVSALDTENSDLKSQNQTLSDKFKEQTKQIEANVKELEEAKLKLTQEKTRFEQEINNYQQVITDLKTNVVSATAENTKLNNDLNVANRRIKELETEIATLTQKIKDKDAEIITLNSFLGAATQARAECEAAKTLIGQKNIELALEISKLEDAIKKLQEQLDSNTTTSKQESIELNKKITDLTNELRKSILKNWINDYIEVDIPQNNDIIITSEQFNDFCNGVYPEYLKYFKENDSDTLDTIKERVKTSLFDLNFTQDCSRGSGSERCKAQKDKMSPIMQKLIKEKEEFAKLYKDNAAFVKNCTEEKDKYVQKLSESEKAKTLCEEEKSKLQIKYDELNLEKQQTKQLLVDANSKISSLDTELGLIRKTLTECDTKTTTLEGNINKLEKELNKLKVSEWIHTNKDYDNEKVEIVSTDIDIIRTTTSISDENTIKSLLTELSFTQKNQVWINTTFRPVNIKKLQDQITSLTQEKKFIDDQLKVLKTEKGKLGLTLIALETTQKETEGKKTQAENELKVCNQNLLQCQKDLEKIKEKDDKIQEQMLQIQTLKKENEKISILEEDNRKLKEQIEPLSRANQDLQSKLDTLQSQFDALKTLQETTQSTLEKCESEKQTINGELIVKEGEIAKLSEAILKCATAKEAFALQITELDSKLDKYKPFETYYQNYCKVVSVGNWILNYGTAQINTSGFTQKDITVTVIDRIDIETTFPEFKGTDESKRRNEIKKIIQKHFEFKALKSSNQIVSFSKSINNIDYTRLYGPVVLDKIRSTGITFDNIVKAGFASEGYNIDLWSPVSIKGGKNLKILLKYNI